MNPGKPITVESVCRTTGGVVSALTVYVPEAQPDYAAALCRRLTELGTTDWRVVLPDKPPVGPPLDTV